MADRLRVTLVCDECGARNYQTTRARDTQANRLSIKKFCKTCGKHTEHKESK
jgi:large subunit ribosomal protein L33